MNDQRRQDYINLIQELLHCSDGEEFSLLFHQHPDLLDQGLLQEMGQVVKFFRQRGQESNAAWLENMAIQLDQLIGLDERSLPQTNTTNDLDAILFRLSLPLFDGQQGIEQRVQLCRQALEMVSSQENQKLWGALKFELGNNLCQNPLGNRAENLEEAIAAYEQSLQVAERATWPIEWAQSKMNLANAYYLRICGDRSQNLEDAITAYEQSAK